MGAETAPGSGDGAEADDDQLAATTVATTTEAAGRARFDAPAVTAEHRFDAMGTWCHVLVVGGDPDLVALAEQEVRRLEAAWTRFDPDSEISRLNRRPGEPVVVSDDTFRLILRAEQAHRRTGGWFDPFLATEIDAAGYDRDYAELEPPSADPVTGSNGEPAPMPRPRPRPEPAVVLDGRRHIVTLAPGTAFDAGGIGKGVAADLVAGTLRRADVDGVLVNLGGDLACWGTSPAGRWEIALDDPLERDAPPVATLRLDGGGLCTSTPLRRRWRTASGEDAHHLLDPGTGRPAPVTVAAVTVVAPTAGDAEALTKAVYLAGPERGADLLRRHDAGAVIVGLDRSIHRL